ncbi:hypothetical protein PF004_g32157 [Phytophthora fragariae]|uniref:Eukaryotic/viral aspartic protease n=1 Tax=Phytophthora fragariae TaxID=53985 RepID=A0A6G0M7Y9_9STRA|nr:hypothetical protein PF004_g32157 [Phytophthora fragariae]
MVKVTLGWEIVYEFEVWIMDHHAGVDVILGTDFMIPAGIRLDLFNSKAKLPDEIEINLIKSASAREDTEYGNTICGGPTETMDVASRLTAEFKLPRRPPDEATHELWVRRVNKLVPTGKSRVPAPPIFLWCNGYPTKFYHSRRDTCGWTRRSTETGKYWRMTRLSTGICRKKSNDCMPSG